MKDILILIYTDYCIVNFQNIVYGLGLPPQVINARLQDDFSREVSIWLNVKKRVTQRHVPWSCYESDLQDDMLSEYKEKYQLFDGPEVLC